MQETTTNKTSAGTARGGVVPSPITIGRFLIRMLGWFKPYPAQVALIFFGLLTDMAWNSIVPKSFEHLVSESYPAGRAVVVEGDPGDKFFLIVRGELAVTQRHGEGERQLTVLQDGDHFGEIALLENSPRTATVTTLVPTTLLSLSRGHFNGLLDQVPGLRAEIQAHHAARVRGQIEEMA